LKIRYKLVAFGSKSITEKGGEVKKNFRSVLERGLPDPDNGSGEGNRETLNLRTGETFNALDGAPKEQGGRLRALVASEGDLFAEYDDYVSKNWALVTANLRLSDFPARQWDSATAQEIVEALKEPTVIQHVENFGATLYLLPENFVPLTLAFETREGSRGLLQITKFEDSPRSLKIRYKLLGKNSDDGAALKPIPPRAAELLKETESLYRMRNSSNPNAEKEFLERLAALTREMDSVLAGTVAEPLLKEQKAETLKLQKAQQTKDEAKVKEATARLKSLGKQIVALIDPSLEMVNGKNVSKSPNSPPENEFVMTHRAKLGQALLDASRDFAEEHQWKHNGERGGTTNGILSVTIEAIDLNGKRVAFQDAQQADGTCRFTVKVEDGSEFSAERIGTAIARRLKLRAGWEESFPQNEKANLQFSAPKLSPEQRAALMTEAQQAFSKFVRSDLKTRGENIPEEFWGPITKSLKPIRVVDDRANIKIVLSDDDIETGLYINLPISSFAPNKADFLEFIPLSQPDDHVFGQIYFYALQKAKERQSR
jgi:hypothetical protein